MNLRTTTVAFAAGFFCLVSRADTLDGGIPILDMERARPAPAGQAEEIAINHPGFKRLVRMTSKTRGPEQKWAANVRWLTNQPVKAGDVLLAVFHLRCVESAAAGGKAAVTVAFGTAEPPHANCYVNRVEAGQEWESFRFAFVARQDHPPGQGKISFGCGMEIQTLEIAGVQVFNFGTTKRVADFQSSAGYPGMEPDAAWRKDCLARIERIRKSPLEVQVTGSDGQPVAGAEVHVAMKRHSFRFGSSFNPDIYQFESGSPEMVGIYQKRFLEYFNLATPEAVINWKRWESRNPLPNLDRALAWLSEHNIPVIGHPMVWQAPKALPDRVHELVRKQDYAAYIRAWDEHLTEKLGAVKGRMCQHWVINEFSDTNFLPEELTDDAIVNWYRMARAADPGARLGILDHRMIGYGAVDAEQNLTWYEKKIEMLLRNKIPLEIIGFQCHFGDVLTPPERVVGILDRFSRFGLELQVVEFDVDTDNEDLQARYLRDFFIAVFSHPAVGVLQQWGFYEPSHWRPRAALFRKDWSAKPNGQAFLELVHNQWRTEEKGLTGADGRYATHAFHGDYEVVVTKGKAIHRERFALPGGGRIVRATLPQEGAGG